MGIWKKISNVARASLNDLLHQLEDPKKLADQALIDLEARKNKAKTLLASALASTKMAQTHKGTLKNRIRELKEQAENFLQQGLEEKARDALQKKLAVEQEEKAYTYKLEDEGKYIDKIKQGLSALEDKISTLRSRSSIEASKQYLEKEDAFQTFSRMEAKIEDKEMHIKALEELLEESSKKAPGELPRASFDKHSDPQALEQELLAMKKKLND